MRRVQDFTRIVVLPYKKYNRNNRRKVFAQTAERSYLRKPYSAPTVGESVKAMVASFDAEKWKKLVFSPNEDSSNGDDEQPRKVNFEKIEKTTDKADKITILCLQAGIVIGVLMALIGIIRAVSDRMWLPIIGSIFAVGLSFLSWLALRYFKKHNLNFDDTGIKIKKVAKLFFIIAVCACIIEAIILLCIAIYISIKGSIIIGLSLFLGALLLLLVGPIFAWLSNLLLYGFGEIVDKVDAIEKNTHRDEEQENEEE